VKLKFWAEINTKIYVFIFQAFHICANDGQGEVAKNSTVTEKSNIYIEIGIYFAMLARRCRQINFLRTNFNRDLLAKIIKNSFCNILTNIITLGVAQRCSCLFPTLNLL
jgi:hypothetical protein